MVQILSCCMLQVLCDCQAMHAQLAQATWTQLLDALVKFLEHKSTSASSGDGHHQPEWQEKHHMVALLLCMACSNDSAFGHAHMQPVAPVKLVLSHAR